MGSEIRGCVATLNCGAGNQKNSIQNDEGDKNEIVTSENRLRQLNEPKSLII